MLISGGICEALNCSARDLRFGVSGAYFFQPTGKPEPWLGLGIGYATFIMGQVLTLHSKLDAEGDLHDLESSRGVRDLRIHTWLHGGVRMQFRF